MKRYWPQLLLIALAVLAVFGQALSFDFVRWDDNLLITGNPYVTPLSLERLGAAWTRAHTHLYVPLTYNLWALLGSVGQASTPDIMGSKLNPYVFHAANVLVHLCSALMVFGILRRCFKDWTWAAAAGAILWAIHPLQVEPVAWATGMKDVLSGALAIAAILLYLRAVESHGDGRAGAKSLMLYLSAYLALFAGSFAKPGIVGVPFFAFAIDWLILGRPLRRAIAFSLPLVIAVIPTVIITQYAQPAGQAQFCPLWARPLIAAHALSTYLQKLIFPDRLAIDYGLSPSRVMQGWWWYVAWIIPAGITLAIALSTRLRKPLGASWIIFLAGVAPVLGLAPFIFQYYSTVADRYMYLSLLGVAMAATWVLGRLPLRVAISVAILAILVLAIRAALQVGVWQDSRTLLLHAIEVNPDSFVAPSSLAAVLSDEANDLSSSVAGLKKDDPSVAAVLSRAAALHAQAEEYVHQSLRAWPEYHTALGNLAEFQMSRGDYEGALQTLQKAVDAMDKFPSALTEGAVDRLTVGKAAMNLKHYDQAAENFRKFLNRYPDSAEAKALLAEATTKAATTRP